MANKQFLPQFQGGDTSFQMMQNTWGSILGTLLARPANNSNILQSIHLTTGSNTVNHKLGQKLQGWTIVRQRAAASIYDTQDSNQTPALTLTLVSDADVTVDIEVF